MDEFTWLVLPGVDIPWQCPNGAVGAWTARGWVTCDPPVERDPTKPDGPTEAEAEPEQAEPVPGPAEEPTSAADTAADTEEGAE